MKIVLSYNFKIQLTNIIDYIAKDKKAAANNFKNELQFKISQLINFPMMYRKSNYYDNENIRDLIFKGYTVVYEIHEDTIYILDIFKWMDK
ncbi:plasmid stabilization protein [Halarcobacter ebronensis]|uniref:Plasmid stabilization protein n=1 Tax=Halarcobacter ebronensis TaxID=1462615 RepID=A0A4Q0YK16_9BACT|nr:type II toxin-antitoxin system RelE/ParE family toxin [Halarcobacter ebronensis]RXJ69509.1 plasmid stabilization protein [Halarcobacter ebronensis]